MATKAIPVRQLGKNGPNVPALGLGVMGMSGLYGTPPSDEERFVILDRALQLGETFWDSANIYGDNEELLGKWFKRTGKRDEIFLSTKFGILMKDGKGVGIDSSPENCKKVCAESLEKLGIDSIDIYYVHRVNPTTPIEDTMRAMTELKADGKIKHIGLSAVTSDILRRAQKIAPVAAVQMEYSPFVLEIETNGLLATCRELGVAVVAYAPLGRGLLTSTFGNNALGNDENDVRQVAFPRFQEENRDHNIKLVHQFKAFADKKGCTTSQLSIAWLLKQGDDIIPIPGTKRITYLEENWGALDVHITDKDEAEIREFVQNAEIAGGKEVDMKKLVLKDPKES